jgi:hypothetical protein
VERPKKGLLETLDEECLNDWRAPDELRRIARAEAEGPLQDGEFEYFSFAVRAWQANGGRWTEELAELLTFEGYKFLKLHGIQDWFMTLVQNWKFHWERSASWAVVSPDDPSYEKEVDSFFRGIEIMEASPELYFLDSTGCEIGLPTPLDGIPPALLKHLTVPMLRKLLTGNEATSHTSPMSERAPAPWLVSRILACLRGLSDEFDVDEPEPERNQPDPLSTARILRELRGFSDEDDEEQSEDPKDEDDQDQAEGDEVDFND